MKTRFQSAGVSCVSSRSASRLQVRSRTGLTLIEVLVVIAIIVLMMAISFPAVQSVRESARRMECMNNLRQIGLGLHQYHDTHSKFPSSTVRRTGTTWVPLLAPFVEQGNLHERYDFNVGWKHPNNADVIDDQISFLRCPSSPTSGRDEIAPGKFAATSDYAAVTQVAKSVVDAGYFKTRNRIGVLNQKPCAMSDISDGLSTTLIITEDAGRPWFYVKKGTGPDNNIPGGGNLSVTNGRVKGAGWADPRNSIPIHGFTYDGLSVPGKCAINCTNNNEAFGFHPGGITALFADGSVRFLVEEIEIDIYGEYVTRAGGEVIDSKYRY